MECGNCGKIISTKNSKFCSRKCSSTVTSHLYPRIKKKIYHCIKCGEECKSYLKYCKYCNPNYVDWDKLTIMEVANKHEYKKGTTIRRLARKNFIDSGRKMACDICGYTNHVEICHIKKIKDFPSSTTIAEVNSPENLLSLCPNHHWELDHPIC